MRRAHILQLILVLPALLLSLGTVRANGDTAGTSRLVADLSINKISIEANFSGERILLFGALSGADLADIVIAIRGPAATALLRQKQQKAGLWVNGEPTSLGPIPVFYALLSNRPISDIAPAATLVAEGIGVETLIQSNDIDEPSVELPNFIAAHARLKRAQGLYFENDTGVEITANRLFRSEILLPAGTPRGTYHVDFYMFENGRLTAMQAGQLDVDYAGLENFLFRLAHGMPLIYGMLGIAIAVAMGWGTATLFRRS
jgi:uncharacterized protein (TIGR02186 family)